MESILKYILSDITEVLKFAETKAATLVAGNAVVIFGVLRIIDDKLSSLYIVLLLVFLGQMAISLVICLVSFIPSISRPWLFKTELIDKDDNLLYFMHIVKYTPEKYLLALDESNDEDKLYSKYELLFARQIVELSVIARRKFKLLKIALWLTLSSVITPIGAYILFKAKKQRIKSDH